MRWNIKQCDILDEPADVLVCSANPHLNLSGGVGGAFLLRYGDEMQQLLHDYLSSSNLKCVDRGTVVQMPPCGSPYHAVLHAVGVDVFYGTSVEDVSKLIIQCFELSAALPARKVAMTAIATGYGRMSLDDFSQAVIPLMDREFGPIEEVAICLRKEHDVAELSELLT